MNVMRAYITAPITMLIVLAVFASVTLVNDWNPARAALYAALWVAAAIFIVRRTARRGSAR